MTAKISQEEATRLVQPWLPGPVTNYGQSERGHHFYFDSGPCLIIAYESLALTSENKVEQTSAFLEKVNLTNQVVQIGYKKRGSFIRLKNNNGFIIPNSNYTE